LTAFNPLQKPGGNYFSRRIFQTIDIVQEAMINLLDKRRDFCIDFREIDDESSIIELSRNDDLDPIVMSMQVLALMTIRNLRKAMR
jgi:hypothetical protein